MNMKSPMLAAALAASISLAAAQPADTPTSPTAASPASAAAATTAPQGQTTASLLLQQNFSAESFERRWEAEEKYYREAGIPEEKIARLREINETLWTAQAGGQAVDYADLRRQRMEVLTPQEQRQIQQARRRMIEQRLDPGARSTTGSRFRVDDGGEPMQNGGTTE